MMYGQKNIKHQLMLSTQTEHKSVVRIQSTEFTPFCCYIL